MTGRPSTFHGAKLFLSVVLAALGVALIVVSVARHDVGKSLFGVLFIGAGVGRFVLERRRPR